MIIEERCTEIEKANRLLLERMTNILAGPATHQMNKQGISPKKHHQAHSAKNHQAQNSAATLPNSLHARKTSNSKKETLFRQKSQIEEENTQDEDATGEATQSALNDGLKQAYQYDS